MPSGESLAEELVALKARLAHPAVKAVLDLVEFSERCQRAAEAAHEAKDEANRRWLKAVTTEGGKS